MDMDPDNTLGFTKKYICTILVFYTIQYLLNIACSQKSFLTIKR